MLHSSAYRNPGPYQGKRVLVVGCRLVGDGDRARPRDRRRGQGLAGGPHAAEHHAAVASRWPARRTDLPAAVPRARSASPTRSAGRRGARTSATSASSGCRSRKRACSAGVKRARARCRRWSTWMSSTPSGTGRSRWSPTVESFDGDKVVLVDGSRLDPTPSFWPPATDAVWNRWSATSACSTRRASRSSSGRRPAADGLRFIGYDVRPSLIGYMAKQSKRMAKRIARELSAG